MNEDLTAFEFDDALEQFRPFPSDTVVESVARDLWFFYDDIKDHKVVASKQDWDYFNRVLLLLESNAEIEEVSDGLRWRSSQIVAGVCFLLVLFLSAWIGWPRVLEVTVPFGIVSMCIWFLSRRKRREGTDESLYPFPSFGSLRAVRRSVLSFSKSAIPINASRRRIRNPIANWLLRVPFGAMWLVFSPIALLIQALPQKTWHTRLKTPERCG